MDINNGHIIFACLKFPQGDINGVTTLTFSFQFIRDLGMLEGAHPHLLKFFNVSFVSLTTFVDQIAGRGSLAGIYMSKDDDVNMSFYLSHFGFD